MDSKTKSQRKVLAAKAKPELKKVPERKATPKKNGKTVEKLHMPELVAGKEVLGRKLSVIKTTKKEAIWVKGAVKEFDEPTIRHKIKYDLPLPEALNEGEEWLCLSKSGFMWKDDDFICPYANPTYSTKYTPKKEEAIGKRVKVFWTAMSKWYQGKVVDYDSMTGKHRVSFRDGEQNQYDLQQEALVWLDIPQLSSEAALKRMRSEEGEPIAVIRNDENQAPVECNTKAGLAKVAPSVTKAVKSKTKQPKAAQENGKVNSQIASKGKGVQKQVKVIKKKGKDASSPATLKASKAAAGKLTGANGHVAPDIKKKFVEDNKSSASTAIPGPAMLSGQTASPKATSPQQANKANAAANGHGNAAGKAASKANPKPAPEDSRKRSRLGDPALTSTTGEGQPEPKRRALAKASSIAAKPLRKPKAGGEESRLGSKRQKKEADERFEQSCQAVLGSRIGVWWEDDNCYYKGKIVAHDWFRKKLKVSYDDGVEEYIQPQKEDTRFTWLTPRACTAGASDAVHSAFHHLGASNAGLPTGNVKAEPAADEDTPEPSPAPGKHADAPAQCHTADGTHLDALVPIQANGSLGSKGEGQGRPGDSCDFVPNGFPLDSATRAVLAGVKAPSLLSAALTGAQQLNCIPASTAGLLLSGLHSILGPNSTRGLNLAQPLNGVSRMLASPLTQQLLQARAGLTPALQPQIATQSAAAQLAAAPRPSSAVSRSGSASEISAAAQSAPPPAQGIAAEGWRVSILFRGDQKQYFGRILAFKQETGRHLVLWEDGEDEWIDISKENLTWHSDRGKSSGFGTGLPAGEEEPEGERLKGWCLAVFWKHECKFFDGVVVDYDGDLDQHTIHYNDGEERCESVQNLVFKYVLPPSVQPVGARRIQPPRRWQDSGSDAEDGHTGGHRRQRRRLRAASHDDDTDDEWTGGRGVSERKVVKSGSFPVPPVRHLSLNHQRHNSLLQQHASSPTVHTPGGSEIRRLSSKCGSLLFFEGEENPAVSPATSPKVSPQISPATRQDTGGSTEGKVQSAVDRRVTGLKSALGFKTGVKRVRLYLQGWTPGSQKSKAALSLGNDTALKGDAPLAAAGKKLVTKQEPSDLPDCVPNKQLVKLMLERVEAASISMHLGTPIALSSATPTSSGSEKMRTSSSAWLASQASLPSKTILSAKSAVETPPIQGTQAKEVVENRSQSVPPAITQQEQPRLTPPPSPFASCFQGSEQSAEGAAGRENPQAEVSESSLLAEASRSSVSRILDQLRAGPGEAKGSPSNSPDTPSAMGEKQMMALSRNGSVMSDSMLAELLQCKLLSCKGQASLEEQLGIFQSK